MSARRKRLRGFLARIIARNQRILPQPQTTQHMHVLSFSALNLAARCGYALYLRRSGVAEKRSEGMEAGLDFHRAVTAALRRMHYEPHYPETVARISLIREELAQISALADLEVDKELSWDFLNARWVGRADAIAAGQVFKFKAVGRLPTEIAFNDYLQVSLYAHVSHAHKVVLFYVTEKRYKKIEAAPLPDVTLLLSRLAGLLNESLSIPYGLFHPYACAHCSFAHSCEFASYRLGEGLVKHDSRF